MKILVVSNFYPPHHVGGYELGCRDVVETLRRRGHEVRVLTSVHGIARPRSDGDVHRWLSIDPAARPRSSPAYALSLLAAEVRAARALGRLVRQARPDVVHLWNLRYLPLAIAREARRRGLPVASFVSDDWLAGWETVDRWEQWTSHWPRHPLKRRLKQLLVRVADRARPGPRRAERREALDLRHVQFASRALAEACLAAGKPVERATVVHWGVDTGRFSPRDPTPPTPRLLYAGQVVPHKGVHTAIEACRLLRHTHGVPGVELTIAGGSVRPDYLAHLESLAREAGLGDRVRFTGPLDRERMPALYRAHDVLLFPSIWAEPFSIGLLEAMASGLAVVATATGGSGEILRHGVNALVFAPGDAAACAAHVRTLVDEPTLHAAIAREARRTIEDGFTLERMVDAIERELRAAAQGDSA